MAGRLNPRYIKDLAALLDSYGMAADLTDPKYQDPTVIEANKDYIIEELVANFIASLPAEEVTMPPRSAALPGEPCAPRRSS